MPYHVSVRIEAGEIIYQRDLSREELEDQITEPYKQQQIIHVNRKPIHPKYVKDIRIAYTREKYRDWMDKLEREREEAKRLGAAVPTSVPSVKDIIRLGENVTYEFLPDAPKRPPTGNVPGPEPADSSWLGGRGWDLESIQQPITQTQQPTPARTRGTEDDVMNEPLYDVALSYAGEDRAFVEGVANVLKNHGVKVFYDKFEAAYLWGKDLGDELDAIYRKKSRYVVMFISEHYARKAYPNHERKSAFAKALESNQEYVLPARFDKTEIPGLRSTTAIISLKDYTPDSFAQLIIAKLAMSNILVSNDVQEVQEPDIDMEMLKHIGDEALATNNEQVIETDAILKRARDAQISDEDANDALYMLTQQGYVEPIGNPIYDGQYGNFELTFNGMEAYAKKFVKNYDASVVSIAQAISDSRDKLDEETMNNVALGHAFGMSPRLAEHILILLENMGCIDVAKPIGPKVYVFGVHPPLRRFLKNQQGK